MTEEKARTKWCPQNALILATEAITGNAEGTGTCMASDCALWKTVVSIAEGEAGNYPDDGHCGLINN